MNRPTVMDKERLAAFADGELSPEEAAAVVMHLADHPEDQAFVDDLMAANAALAEAYAGVLAEPVPPALRALVLGEAPAPTATVVPFRARVMARPAATLAAGLAAGAALAAGLMLAVFLPAADPLRMAPGPLASGSDLSRALTDLPAGAVRQFGEGAEVTVLATLPVPGGYCREIEVMRPATDRLEAGLACTTGTGWQVEAVITEALTAAAGDDGFGTASGAEAQGFAPFLDRIGAGALLSPDEEAAAMAKGWTR
jgi:hypothetical protein